ncbi:16S rRNA (guanine(966)-N(2))-methyltransferase RsmD [Flavobacterium sp.]|uniref:16S rRNA (guanine(966)-N(2))-methyltransferase RsmD n=1 Tax=Flavobacterium sp. TaxID=239 RepID=UPI002601964B|nr:16S rRNA (guanine(966)-N(2))-methyltransferase RsmD [Flavobacterium sp.]
MRIISGKYKGRRLTAPKNLPVRPTTDMSKESLFNILNNQFHFSELKVLDLFSGTGNISYEFGSRGCAAITSIDADFGCVNYIKKTARELDLNITAIKSDVFKFLERHRGNYDVIFADPPYDMAEKDFHRLVELIFVQDLLDEEGVLVVEHSKNTKMEQLQNFSFDRNYGASVFSFFAYSEEE